MLRPLLVCFASFSVVVLAGERMKRDPLNLTWEEVSEDIREKKETNSASVTIKRDQKKLVVRLGYNPGSGAFDWKLDPKRMPEWLSKASEKKDPTPGESYAKIFEFTVKEGQGSGSLNFSLVGLKRYKYTYVLRVSLESGR